MNISTFKAKNIALIDILSFFFFKMNLSNVIFILWFDHSILKCPLYFG